MNKKFVAIAVVLCMTTFAGCTFTQKITESDVEEIVAQAIQENNKTLKTEILNDVNKSISTEINSVKALNAEEREALKNSIMESLNQKISENGTKTQIVKQPVYNYYTTEEKITNVTEENITNITEEHTTNVTEEYITNVTEEHPVTIVKPEVPPKIEDGTPVELLNQLPLTFVYNEKTTITITDIDLTVSNYTPDPYIGTYYPYKLDYIVKATLEFDPSLPIPNVGGPTLNFVLNPLGGQISIPFGVISIGDLTPELTGSIPLNEIPTSMEFVIE